MSLELEVWYTRVGTSAREVSRKRLDRGAGLPADLWTRKRLGASGKSGKAKSGDKPRHPGKGTCKTEAGGKHPGRKAEPREEGGGTAEVKRAKVAARTPRESKRTVPAEPLVCRGAASESKWGKPGLSQGPR